MKEYKPLIFFLIKFFATYFILTIGYDIYLKQTQVIAEHISLADPFTKMVAEQSSSLYNLFINDSKVLQDPNNPYMNFYIEEYNIAIINEGCNAMSVIIIMVSFIIAFGVKLITTILYTLVSIVLVYLVNLVRIIILAFIFYNQSEFGVIAHDALFPGIIYGAVIVICFVWIRFFVFRKINNE